MLNKEMCVVHSSLSSYFMKFRGFRFGGTAIGSSAETCVLEETRLVHILTIIYQYLVRKQKFRIVTAILYISP